MDVQELLKGDERLKATLAVSQRNLEQHEAVAAQLMTRRCTLCGWQAALACLSMAVVLRMKYLVLQSEVIHTDDSATSEGWRVQWETVPPGKEPKPRSLDGRQEGNRMI